MKLSILLLLVVNAAIADDARYCSIEPVRNDDGTIKRSAAVVREFRQYHPCPSTGKVDGPCEGWQVDHVIPLAVGGCDSVVNLQWLPIEIKTCPGDKCKDRWERKVYRR